jgi:RNA polymerase sigma factor (sigma-70 family)
MPFTIDSPNHPANTQPLPLVRVSGASLEELSDGELLEAVRDGRVEAYGTLFTRHRTTAIHIANGVLGNYDLAVDTAHESFSSILSAIQAGSGPVDTFKGYLRAAVKREAYKQSRRRTMETPVPEHPDNDHPVEDFTTDLFDPALSEAFKSLPHRWQQVIWHLDVEDRTPRDVAPLFGLTPNALVALHRRAKKGLTNNYNKTSGQ